MSPKFSSGDVSRDGTQFCPNFKHTDRSNLQKVLQTIGTISESDKFIADSTTYIRDAVDNFEKLDLLIHKIDNFVQIVFFVRITIDDSTRNICISAGY